MPEKPKAVTSVLPYDPGRLPTRPAPLPGETVDFTVQGFPPFKDLNRSIRNRKHPQHADFKRLREAAIAAMDGRAWYFGPIGLDLTVYVTKFPPDRALIDYLGGVCDTLDGSSGPSFTFLPIIYEDDCQICEGRRTFLVAEEPYYTIKVTFLSQKPTPP